MVVKKVFRRLIAGSVILTLFFSSLLCPTPLLFPAKAAPAREYQGSDVIHILNSLLRQTAAENQTQQAAAGSLQEGQADLNPPDPNFIENNNQSGLPQEEMDRIINEHLRPKQRSPAPNRCQATTLGTLQIWKIWKISKLTVSLLNTVMRAKRKDSLNVQDIIKKENDQTARSSLCHQGQNEKRRFRLLKQKEADPNIE